MGATGLRKWVGKWIQSPAAVDVVYDDSFFREGWFETWADLKYVLADLIGSQPGWRRVIDFGCGPGVMIDLMNRRGVDYVGCDFSPQARRLYEMHFGEYPHQYVAELEACRARSFDLLLSFDVFEHMTDAQIRELLDQFSRVPWLFLNISRAKGIAGHINIKSDRKWLSFFRKLGYTFRRDHTEVLRHRYLQLRENGPDLWHKNMFVFERRR